MENTDNQWKKIYKYFPYFTFSLLVVSVIIAVSGVQQRQQTQSQAQLAAPTPTPPPGFTQNPLDMQVLINIKIPGVGADGNKNPVHRSRKATVTLFNLQDQQIAQAIADVTFNGDVFSGVAHFGEIKNGTYYVKVSTDGSFESIVLPQMQDLSTSKLNILPVVGLVFGDVNRDKKFDDNDYTAAIDCMKNKTCEEDAIMDINDDGIIDISDYNLFLQTNWKTQGD